MSIYIEKNSPSCATADAILCCKEALKVGGGAICNSILSAAGHELKDEIDQHGGFPLLHVAEAKPYNLRFKRVLYTVMPHYDGTKASAAFVSGVYDNAFRYAESHRIKSLAVPLYQAKQDDPIYEKLLRIVVDAAIRFSACAKNDMKIVLIINGLSEKLIGKLTSCIDKRFCQGNEEYVETELLYCCIGSLRIIVDDELRDSATSDELYCERANISVEDLSAFRRMPADSRLPEQVAWNLLLALQMNAESLRKAVRSINPYYSFENSRWASIILFLVEHGIVDLSILEEGLRYYEYQGLADSAREYFL